MPSPERRAFARWPPTSGSATRRSGRSVGGEGRSAEGVRRARRQTAGNGSPWTTSAKRQLGCVTPRCNTVRVGPGAPRGKRCRGPPRNRCGRSTDCRSCPGNQRGARAARGRPRPHNKRGHLRRSRRASRRSLQSRCHAAGPALAFHSSKSRSEPAPGRSATIWVFNVTDRP